MERDLGYSKPNRYDSNVTEFFVQTSETVKIRRSDLERYQQADQIEDAAFVEDGSGEPAAPPGPTALDSLDALQQNLSAFTDSVHSKASQVLQWVGNVESMNTERSNQRRMNAALRLLYRSGAWLPAAEAELISDHGMTALRAISKCAELSVAYRQPLFPLHAKIHMLYHQFRYLKLAAKRCCFVESILTDECQCDEGFVGTLARLSRRCSPKATIRRTIDLYLSLLHKRWSNQPVESE
eukprot:Skav215302  [mRNA]  locus=scaffold3969:10053:14745:- [translate_table: standard]